jgi:PAS domain S-box-containing protein
VWQTGRGEEGAADVRWARAELRGCGGVSGSDARHRQRQALGDLARKASACADAGALLHEAAAGVTAALTVPLCEVLEYRPADACLVPRAGTGWRESLAGRAATSATTDTLAGYALLVRTPVRADDLGPGAPFRAPAHHAAHGVMSGLAAVIPGEGGPWGVLAAYATRPRTFTDDEAAFLETAAAILALGLRCVRAETAAAGAGPPEGEPRFRALTAALSDHAVITLDPEGRIIDWSEGAARLTGYRAEEALGRQATFLYPPDDADPGAGPRRLARAAVEGRLTTTGRRLRKDGTRVWGESVIAAVRDPRGQLSGYLLLLRDAAVEHDAEAARVRPTHAEAARAETDTVRARLAFLVEAGALLSASLDTEVVLRRVAHLAVPALGDACAVYVIENGVIRRAAAASTGAAAEALLPVTVDGATGPAAVIAGILRGGAPPLGRGGQTVAGPVPGAVMPALAVPLRIRERTLGAMLFVRVDPARPYRADDRGRGEELARVAALALENARLYREAREALQVRDHILATVSHDLKNPLTVIRTLAQGMGRRAADQPALAESMALIEAAVTKMSAMIEDLLDAARLSMGQPLDLRRRRTDLVRLVRQMAEAHQRTTDRHHLRVKTAADELVGEWDPARLERVLDNLLANAIKFSPAGGTITLTLAREAEERADPSAPADGRPPPPAGWAVLTVHDEGIGIPTADLPRIFTRFHRGANVPAQIAGSGIGLAGTRQIVEQHGGTITATSTEGRGTTITVRLPLG